MTTTEAVASVDAQRDCDLLNSSIVPFEEIRFLAPNSSELNPTFVTEFKQATPTYSVADRSLYRAVYNRLPVMVKKVKIYDSLPSVFTVSDILALRARGMTTYRLLREVIVGLALPRHGNLCQVIGWALPPADDEVAAAVDGTTKRAVTSFFMILDRYDDDLGLVVDKLFKAKGAGECHPKVGGPLGWGQFFRVATELAAGLARLAQVRRGRVLDGNYGIRNDYVVHRDLKLANVFVIFSLHEVLEDSGQRQGKLIRAEVEKAPQGAKPTQVEEKSKPVIEPRIATVAIGDFGSSRIEGYDTNAIVSTTNLGTLFYQAPELLDPEKFPEEERLTPQIDIFSYGIVLWRMLHYPKHVGQDFEKQFCTAPLFNEAVVKGTIQPKMDPSLPTDIGQVILDCCAHSPSSRPKAQDLFSRLAATESYQQYFAGKERHVVRDICKVSIPTKTKEQGAAPPKQERDAAALAPQQDPDSPDPPAAAAS